MVHCLEEKFSMRTRNIGANPFQGQPRVLKVPGDYCRKSSLFIFCLFFLFVVVVLFISLFLVLLKRKSGS